MLERVWDTLCPSDRPNQISWPKKVIFLVGPHNLPVCSMSLTKWTLSLRRVKNRKLQKRNGGNEEQGSLQRLPSAEPWSLTIAVPSPTLAQTPRPRASTPLAWAFGPTFPSSSPGAAPLDPRRFIRFSPIHCFKFVCFPLVWLLRKWGKIREKAESIVVLLLQFWNAHWISFFDYNFVVMKFESGEGMAAIPVIKQCIQRRPDLTILMTTTTSSALYLRFQSLIWNSLCKFYPFEKQLWTYFWFFLLYICSEVIEKRLPTGVIHQVHVYTFT